MNMVSIVLMVIGIVGALLGMSKQKQGAPWGQPLAILGAVIAIGAALYSFYGQATGNSSDSIRDREQRFMYVQGKILGETVKAAAPGVKKIAVLVDPMEIYEANGEKKAAPLENTTMQALKDVFPGVEFITVCKPMKKVEIPKQKMPDGTEMEMPFMPDTMITRVDFKNLEKEIKKAEVFIAISNIPLDMSIKEVLGDLKGMKVAMFNVSSLQDVAAAFESNASDLVAVVSSKNTADWNVNPPRDDQKAFDLRFVLITGSDYQQKIAEAEKQK